MDKFLTIEDLNNLPEPKWLIEGLFEQDSLCMLVGPPGSFKSFLAIDWALSLASGRPWSGRAVKPSRVLYALGEGKASLLKRITAWACHTGLCRKERDRFYYAPELNANFRVTFDVPQLGDRKDTIRFITELEQDDFKPTILIVDTLARSYVGKNENDPMDAGVWVESVDKLRQKGMTVLVLHHTKKNQEFGLKYRGTTAFLGAMDTSFILERNPEGFKGYAKLSCDKQKDHMEPPDVWLRWKQIKPEENAEGSIVLVETEKPMDPDEEADAAEAEALNQLIDSVLGNSAVPSIRAKAKMLASQASLPVETAYTKIRRRVAKQKLSTG